MKKFGLGLAAIVAFSGTIFADSLIVMSGSPAAITPYQSGFWANTPAWISNATPPVTTAPDFWNNASDDSGLGPGQGSSHMMNIGYVLSNTGGMTGTSSVLVSGTGTVASDLENPDGSDPIAFSFIRDATAYNISLIFADGGLDTGNSASNGVGTTLGYYIDNVFTPIYNVGMTTGPTGTQAFDPAALGGNYGLYATVCYTAVGGVCTSSELYTSGIGNFGTNTQGAGWNHFACSS